MRRLVVNQRGVTIAEVLIAVGIIGIGLLALCSAIPIAAYGIQEGKQLSMATFLANQRMEQVRNAKWSDVDPVGGAAVDRLGVSASATVAPVGDGGATTFPDETPIAAPYADYTRTVRITDCNVAPGCNGALYAGLRRVTVTASYKPMTGVGVAANGVTKSAVVTIYISQR
jgi:type II secretory pathway pseudopilin PulG